MTVMCPPASVRFEHYVCRGLLMTTYVCVYIYIYIYMYIYTYILVLYMWYINYTFIT